MNCPKCNNDVTRVIDSRLSKNNSIHRRRKCSKCNTRFSSKERIVRGIAGDYTNIEQLQENCIEEIIKLCNETLSKARKILRDSEL